MGAKSPRSRAVIRGKRRGGLSRVFTQYDHGEPIKAIDTRPMAFVFGLVALVMLFVANQPRPQVLLLDLPYYLPPPMDTSQIPKPALYDVRISSQGVITLNELVVDLDSLSSSLSTIEPNPHERMLRLLPDPNAPYGLTLEVLGLMGQLNLLDQFDFCLGNIRRHRNYQEGGSGALPILLTMGFPNPHYRELCGDEAFPVGANAP